jgi:O-methyltransferase
MKTYSSAGEDTGTLTFEDKLHDLLNSQVVSRLIYVVAKLGVPDAMTDGVMTSDQLAVAVNADPGALYRVMRTLAGYGLFAEKPKGYFELTELGGLLRSDHPDSQRAFAILAWEPWMRAGWDGILTTVKTGTTAFKRVHGMEFFEYLNQDSDAADLFNRAMTSLTRKEIDSILSAYDFSRFSKVADVGGGHGGLLAAILKKHRSVAGILFDLPRVLEGARNLLEKEAVLGRCTLAAGDFFSSITPGVDAYILKSVIHDWNDEEAVRILRNCRLAVPDTGRILVIERLIEEEAAPSPARLMDIVMLVNVSGKERTRDEYGSLFAESGFRLQRTIPTSSEMNIIEAVPV